MPRIKGDTTSAQLRTQAVEAEWFGRKSCPAIASTYGLSKAAVYLIWQSARELGRLPAIIDRPNYTDGRSNKPNENAMMASDQIMEYIDEDQDIEDEESSPRHYHNGGRGAPRVDELGPDPLLAMLQKHHNLADVQGQYVTKRT
jgi:hypothetical protein